MHYNRKPLIGDLDPWTHLFINVDYNDIASSRPHSILSIAGTTILHQHEITFITGATHCRAHAFAKIVAASILNGGYPFAQSVQVAKREDNEQGRVLWIDTVHSFYSVCAIIDDLQQNFKVNSKNFQMMCLDDLGCFNERFERVLSAIIDAIYEFKPQLVIIDDLDHLATDCGYNLTENFYLMIREALDHLNTSLLCVGYNLIGRAKSTAGSIGKRLFGISNNIFRIITRGTVNLVQQVKCVTDDCQTEFAFNINDKNFAQEVIMTPDDSSIQAHYIEAASIQEILSTAMSGNQELSSHDLIKNLDKCKDSYKRLKRNQLLIATALANGIINRTDDGKYCLNSPADNDNGETSISTRDYLDDYVNHLRSNKVIPPIPPEQEINSLTFIKHRARPSARLSKLKNMTNT